MKALRLHLQWPKLLAFINQFKQKTSNNHTLEKGNSVSQGLQNQKPKERIVEVSENTFQKECKRFTDRRTDTFDEFEHNAIDLANIGPAHGTDEGLNKAVQNTNIPEQIKAERKSCETKLNLDKSLHRAEVESEKLEIEDRIRVLMNEQNWRSSLEYYVADERLVLTQQARTILATMTELEQKILKAEYDYHTALKEYNTLKEIDYNRKEAKVKWYHYNGKYYIFLGLTIPLDSYILRSCLISNEIQNSDFLNTILAWGFAAFIAVFAHVTGNLAAKGNKTGLFAMIFISIGLMLFLAAQRASLEGSITMTLANFLVYGIASWISYLRHIDLDYARSKIRRDKTEKTFNDLNTEKSKMNKEHDDEMERINNVLENKLQDRRKFELEVNQSALKQINTWLNKLDSYKKFNAEILDGIVQRAIDTYTRYFNNAKNDTNGDN